MHPFDALLFLLTIAYAANIPPSLERRGEVEACKAVLIAIKASSFCSSFVHITDVTSVSTRTGSSSTTDVTITEGCTITLVPKKRQISTAAVETTDNSAARNRAPTASGNPSPSVQDTPQAKPTVVATTVQALGKSQQPSSAVPTLQQSSQTQPALIKTSMQSTVKVLQQPWVVPTTSHSVTRTTPQTTSSISRSTTVVTTKTTVGSSSTTSSLITKSSTISSTALSTKSTDQSSSSSTTQPTTTTKSSAISTSTTSSRYTSSSTRSMTTSSRCTIKGLPSNISIFACEIIKEACRQFVKPKTTTVTTDVPGSTITNTISKCPTTTTMTTTTATTSSGPGTTTPDPPTSSPSTETTSSSTTTTSDSITSTSSTQTTLSTSTAESSLTTTSETMTSSITSASSTTLISSSTTSSTTTTTTTTTKLPPASTQCSTAQIDYCNRQGFYHCGVSKDDGTIFCSGYASCDGDKDICSTSADCAQTEDDGTRWKCVYPLQTSTLCKGYVSCLEPGPAVPPQCSTSQLSYCQSQGFYHCGVSTDDGTTFCSEFSYCSSDHRCSSDADCSYYNIEDQTYRCSYATTTSFCQDYRVCLQNGPAVPPQCTESQLSACNNRGFPHCGVSKDDGTVFCGSFASCNDPELGDICRTNADCQMDSRCSYPIVSSNSLCANLVSCLRPEQMAIFHGAADRVRQGGTAHRNTLG